MKKLEIAARLRCGAAPVILAAALVTPAMAIAQDQPQEAQEAGFGNEVIIVTGSRIPKPQLEASIPIAVVSAKSIQQAGQTNLLDALRDTPVAGQSAGRSASNFSNSGNGEATVNLRNLGISRTLVLINGRRSVGVPGDSAVDLNNIPTDLIDHVEIVTGGASAIYGSDAVAGVVNIILKNKFKGLELHAQDMISSRGDAGSVLLSALGGTDFSDGKGHVVANFTYTKDNALRSSARAYSRFDSPTGSAYSPQGVFFGNNDAYSFDPNGNVISWTGAPSDRYNRASERLLAVPVKRYTASVLGGFDFSSAAQLYGELTYSKTKASGHIEPLAVDDGGNQGQSVFNFDGSLPFTGLTTDNPYTPAAILASEGPGVPLSFFKRSVGIFDRSPQVKRDFYRGVIGMKGEITSDWSYDLSYEHSQVRDVTKNEAILMNNYGAALNATTIGGQIVCADPAARAAGCVPINIFGRQYPYSAAQLKWLTTYAGGVTIPGANIGDSAATAELNQRNYQDVASLALTGSLLNLPGGPLGVALGAEYRREKVSAKYDPFTRSGWTSQQLNGNTTGKYNVKEAFVELNAPLLSNRPFVYALSLEGAARYADYSTLGGFWTYKYGGSYAPSPDIRFRAIYARAVRAPNLNELYAPIANTAQQVVDPCDQAQGLGGAAIAPLPAACTSIPGIATYLQSNPNFAYSLAQVQTIFGYTGGNPNLGAEATNTFTAGATFTPQFLKNFYITADYYRIKVKNAVALVDPQTSVDQCFLTGAASFCNSVHRDANGFITQVDQQQINAASYLVSGVDVQANYSFNTNMFNADERWSLDLHYNHKFKQEQTPFAGGPVTDELGQADTYASQQLGTGFKDQFTLNVDYATGPVSLHYRLKYYGPVKASFGATDISISSYTYSDFQAKLNIAKKFELYLGVNNAFDKQPPFIIGGNSQWPGTNTVADTYDLFGRMFYAGITAKF